MSLNQTMCYRCVGDIQKMIKYGKTKSGSQRYICRVCGKTRVGNYVYRAYRNDTNQKIIQLIKQGLGIRSTARILKRLNCSTIFFSKSLVIFMAVLKIYFWI